MSVLNCVSSLKNISKTQCEALIGQIVGLWLDQSETGVSLTNALLQATWTTKIRATSTDRMYVLYPDTVHNVIRNKEEALFVEGNTKDRRKVRDGKLTFQFEFVNLSFCLMNRLKSFDGFAGFAYFITKNEAIIGSGSSTQLQPVEINMYVNEPVPPETSDDLWKITVDITVVPESGYFRYSVLPYEQTTGAWRPSTVQGITGVELSSITADISDKVIHFYAKSVCDDTEIISLTTASQWEVKLQSTGADITIDSVSCTVDGYYTLAVNTGTPLTAAVHTIRLKDATTNSLSYETDELSEFTPVP